MFLKFVLRYFDKNNFQIKMTPESPFSAVTVRNIHVVFGSWHPLTVTGSRRLLGAWISGLLCILFRISFVTLIGLFKLTGFSFLPVIPEVKETCASPWHVSVCDVVEFHMTLGWSLQCAPCRNTKALCSSSSVTYCLFQCWGLLTLPASRNLKNSSLL